MKEITCKNFVGYFFVLIFATRNQEQHLYNVARK
nr:MAG TPA: hypothetical protein [Caudoviricetes sp.]